MLRGDLWLPAADPTGIQVDKVVARVITHAAGLQVQGRLVHLGQIHARQADIDGLALGMQGAGSHLAARLLHGGIGRR